MRSSITFGICVIAVSLLAHSSVAQDPLSIIKEIQRGGKGVSAAADVAAKVEKGTSVSLEQVVAAMKGANPIAKNWLLGLAQTFVDKQPAAVAEAALSKILLDEKNDSEARYWALDRLAGSDKAKREKLLESRIDDSSLDIRYEAIELALSKLKDATDAAKESKSDAEKLIPTYKKLLDASRLPEQVNVIADKLTQLGLPVDVRSHFGFVSSWQVIAPFDNRNGVGFAAVYPPETEYLRLGKLDTKSKYPGKTSEVGWTAAGSDKPDGSVDLNPVFANEKGAVAYAYVEVQSGSDVECEVRLGCINANKVWVNGQEAFANEVYHTGAQIDQYVGVAKLKKGVNTVLVKVCQNEQTESWAQNWAFQLRFSDATGRAIAVTQ